MKKNRLTVVSNGTLYTFRDVPERKYRNYLSLFLQDCDTTNFRPGGFPFKLQVEPTNRCNLHCPLCPVGSNQLGRPSVHMKLDTFRDLVDDMGQYLLFLILWNWGEPFTNPDLPAMIEYAHAHGIKTVTSTNAHFLGDSDYIARILTSGLTTLIVAIDSLDPERYAVYRRRGRLDVATAGLKNLVRLKRELGSETLINLRMIVMRQNEHEVDGMREFARSVGADMFTAKTLNPSCGLDARDDDSVPLNPRYRRYEYKKGTFERIRVDQPCRRVFSMANIFAGGEVVPCGYDFRGELRVGSILEQPFSEIWMGEAFTRMRRRIWLEKQTVPKCEACIVNFKFSRTGEYPEVTYFNQSLPEKARHVLLEGARKIYDSSESGKRIIKAVEKSRRALIDGLRH